MSKMTDEDVAKIGRMLRDGLNGAVTAINGAVDRGIRVNFTIGPAPTAPGHLAVMAFEVTKVVALDGRLDS